MGAQPKVVATNGNDYLSEDGWRSMRSLFWPTVMIALVIASAIGVIYVSHLNRKAFGEYQTLITARDELETEWGKLLLEQSALASYSRVESIALKRLGMRVPESTDVIMVQQ